MTTLGEVLTRGDVAAASGKRHHARRVPSPAVALAAVTLLLVVVAAAWPDSLAGSAPDVTDLHAALDGPSWSHPFGTDQLGRDVLARVVHGARASLLLGVGASALGFTAGSALGLAAALGGRLLDGMLMRITDVLLAFPELLLALLVIAVAGPGQVNALVAIAVASVPGYARVARARALLVRQAGFVEGCVSVGVPRQVIVLRHMVPNALGPLLVLATVGVGTAIISGSALSFLGLGSKPPTPEWGSMLAEGRTYLEIGWWVVLFPGAAIVATVTSVTVLGRYAWTRTAGTTP
ncbi:binding-protein-dependent transport systems inner membrane component [Candidatus Protofrankia californiensis]|uniref:Binding-protein-dependent transport systems inner membrane component n=1 Tax=Candidatus Protofrankia californiensis TaxID=1839754 RepID=A0A1C3NYF7_9ACTN|nr:binding-protein-dependent transport systems inner membrane component [Candidatus Protofrankia californiensis]